MNRIFRSGLVAQRGNDAWQEHDVEAVPPRVSSPGEVASHAGSTSPLRWDSAPVGHSNRSRYALGGLAIAVGMEAGHVLGFAGVLAAPFAETRTWLLRAADASGERYALRVIRMVTEQRGDELKTFGQRIRAARGAQALAPDGRRGEIDAKFALGCELFAYGLRYTHAPALAGLFALGTVRMTERLENVAGKRRTLGARLLPSLRDDFADLDRLGRRSAFGRGAAAYAERCRRFAEREAATDDRTWREGPVTRLQRWTIMDTAEDRGLPLPILWTCGDAHDWLQANGAIRRYRKGQD